MNIQKLIFKNKHLFLLATLAPSVAYANTVCHECTNNQTVFFGENIITTALATELNNQLSNATDFTQSINLEKEIAQLNILITQKDEFIKITQLKIHSLGESSRLGTKDISRLQSELSKLTSEKAKLANSLNKAKSIQDGLQAELDKQAINHKEILSKLSLESAAANSKTQLVERNLETSIQKREEEHRSVSNHIDELENILNIANTNKDESTDIKFSNVIDGVKSIIKTNGIANRKAESEANFDRSGLESISSKMKELESRLRSSLISGSFTEQLYYITSDHKLRNEELKYTNEIFKFAAKYKNVNVYITGRADPRGTISFNTDLAANRAEFVKKLALKHGIPSKRIHVSSHITKAKVKENSELHFFDRNTTVVITRG